ncbi:AI-2E family transporter [Microbacterium sorbitolivorans]|uniref:AI-2E family transporter n=2 Tax=Microbacterium sorbitolivorans TaxID=1867410 RepID=A0A367Y255_9MICO|nr:AI-2E family transporter [Microbacterium sorbitolivorans]GGF41069.1 AI-2E family transporter [Microbacterium sorbitolivorans]
MDPLYIGAMSIDRAPRRVAALPPAIRILVVLACSVIALGGMWLARDVIGPLAIGAVIVIICYPLGTAITRWGAPRWVGSTAVILLGYVILGVLAALLAFAITEFVRLVTELMPDLTRLTQQVYMWLRDLGVDAEIGTQISAMLNTSRLIDVATSLSGSVISVVTALFFVLAYVIFMSVDVSRYARAEHAFGPQVRPVLDRIRSYCAGVRRYFVVNAVFGLIVAVVDTIALYILDVPAPLVWGILSFVTNFIPNVGFILGLVPPALISLVTNDWVTSLIVIAVYIVANVTLQVLVQPKFVSDAVGITLTLSFFSVVFWTVVIGPLGAILAVPLTLLVRAFILESDPAHSWLRWLTGDDEAAAKPWRDQTAR